MNPTHIHTTPIHQIFLRNNHSLFAGRRVRGGLPLGYQWYTSKAKGENVDPSCQFEPGILVIKEKNGLVMFHKQEING